MKLLVVGHTYLLSFYQRKYAAMKRSAPDLQLRLVFPHESHHALGLFKPEKDTGLESFELVALRAGFNRSHMTRVLCPTRLAWLMKTFSPTHVHIEEDPHSLLGVETVLLADTCCPQASISFFIWDNLGRVPGVPLRWIKKGLTEYCLSRSSLVICGNREAERLLRVSKGYSGESSIIPQVGLDVPDDTDSSPVDISWQGATNSGPIIGFLGRLVPEKGVLLLMRALQRLRERPWRLLIVGDGPLTGELRGRWKNEFGPRLVVLDAVPHSMVDQYMKWLDIFVLPSYSTARWKEQFGLALAQAMMAGVACVGSSCGAIPEVLGPAGIVFEERDEAELAGSIAFLLDDVTARRELGAKAREYALKNYTNPIIARKHLDEFQKIGNRKRIETQASGSRI